MRRREAAANFNATHVYGSPSLENGMENIQDACVVDAASPGGPYDWHSIDWKRVQRFVGKAQMRIAQAELDKDYRRVKRL